MHHPITVGGLLLALLIIGALGTIAFGILETFAAGMASAPDARQGSKGVHKVLFGVVALAAAVYGCRADAAGKPLSIILGNATVTEGQAAQIPLTVSGGNGRAVTVTWSAGGASGTLSVKTGSWRIAVPTLDDALVNGTRTVPVTAKVTSGSVQPVASSTLTILDNDVAPPPAPTPAPPPPGTAWVAAPLQDGAFARVRVSASSWSRLGPGAGRALIPGEIVAVYFNGWGYEASGQASFAIYALSDGASGRALAGDLEGVAPASGTPPPPLPADWWVPGLVTAARSCADIRASGPGVSAGGTYRAAMVAGSHMKLADGQTSPPAILWEVFATGDHNAPNGNTALTIVPGDCLVGLPS
jgi:hypothetical protein